MSEIRWQSIFVLEFKIWNSSLLWNTINSFCCRDRPSSQISFQVKSKALERNLVSITFWGKMFNRSPEQKPSCPEMPQVVLIKYAKEATQADIYLSGWSIGEDRDYFPKIRMNKRGDLLFMVNKRIRSQSFATILAKLWIMLSKYKP